MRCIGWLGILNQEVIVEVNWICLYKLDYAETLSAHLRINPPYLAFPQYYQHSKGSEYAQRIINFTEPGFRVIRL